MLHFQSPPSPLSKVPVNLPPPVSPAVPLWRQLPFSRAFCYVSFELLNNRSNMKIFDPYLKGPWRVASRMFPKTGLLWKQMPISRSLLGISFGVPSKGPFPLGSPFRAPSLIGALFPECFFTHLSKSPV
jgi:hypothetical protein